MRFGSRLRNVVRALRRPRQPARPWTRGDGPRVLFVHGLGGTPMRYRVLHQVEQLDLERVACAYCGDEDGRLLGQVARCDVLYLYRVRETPQLRAALTAAQARGVPVVFDTDDMIWDQRLIEYCFVEKHYGPADIPGFREIYRQSERLLRHADAYVASTPYLAEQLGAYFDKPTYVNANTVSHQALALSEPYYRRRKPSVAGAPVRISYVSGWPRAHEEDFGEALPALLRVLRELPYTLLSIVGHFDSTDLPPIPAHQIEVAPFMAWEEIPRYLSGVDINLAPILDNPHRRSKSAVKFFEAALVGAPTVASDLEPYRDIIHGQSGFLASDDDSWYRAVMALATDPARHFAVGTAAHDQVLVRDTTAARAKNFATLLRTIAAGK